MNVIVVENGLEEGFIRKCAVMQRMRVSEIRQLALLRVYWFNIVDRFSEWLLRTGNVSIAEFSLEGRALQLLFSLKRCEELMCVCVLRALRFPRDVTSLQS